MSDSLVECFDTASKIGLKKHDKNTCSGYLVLIDLKDSTSRKIKYVEGWVEHTNFIYNTFPCMIKKIKEKFSKELEVIIVKFIGDAVMSFIKTSKVSNSVSEYILNCVTDYITRMALMVDSVNDNESNIDNIRLKTVITYLTNINIVNIGKSKDRHVKDVLGRGIDFSFRLEKFADSSHIVINEAFKKSVENYIKSEDYVKNNDKDRVYHIIECKKKIKGWEDIDQLFYILTNEVMMEESLKSYTPSSSSGDVTMELFLHYMNKRQKTVDSPELVEKFNSIYKKN